MKQRLTKSEKVLLYLLVFSSIFTLSGYLNRFPDVFLYSGLTVHISLAGFYLHGAILPGRLASPPGGLRKLRVFMAIYMLFGLPYMPRVLSHLYCGPNPGCLAEAIREQGGSNQLTGREVRREKVSTKSP